MKTRLKVSLAVGITVISTSCGGGVIGAVQTAYNVKQARDIMQNFEDARKTQIPLAGTYRLTYSFPGEKDVSVYVRTLRNANMPLMVDRNAVEPGSLLYRGDKVAFDGYMVNCVGSASLQAIPDSLGAYTAGGATADLGGFLIVTEPLGKDQLGREQYVGAFMVVARPDAPGEAGRLAELMAKANAEFEADAKAKSAEAEKKARKDRFSLKRSKNEPEDEDLFSSIKSVMTMAPDGSVKGAVAYQLRGAERMRMTYERVSLSAFEIPPENLENPGIKQLFTGYKKAGAGQK